MSGTQTASEPPWLDPDDAPEWTDEQIARAEFAIGGKVIRPATGTLTRPGEPHGRAAAKAQMSVRLDRDVIEAFKSTGPDWHARINEALRKAAGI